MIPNRVLLSRAVALALVGDGMYNHRPLQGPRAPEGALKGRHVVAVHRPEVREPQFLEQHHRSHHGLEAGLQPPQQPSNPSPEGKVEQRVVGASLDARVRRPGPQHMQPASQRTGCGRDGHAVVVKQDDEGRTRLARVVQRLVGHASSQRAVAHYCHHIVRTAAAITGQRKAQCSRYRIPGVAGNERIMLALRGVRKPGQPAILTQ